MSGIYFGFVQIDHEWSDGWHEFTSPQIPGLYIVSPTDKLSQAVNDIPNVIAGLIQADKEGSALPG